MMTELIILRGLPGSGKSTWARTWASERPARAEVNRDLLRLMLHGGYADREPQVNAVRDAAILALLRKGVSVACSDTNLPSRTVRDLIRLTRQAGAGFSVIDLTHIPLTVCLERNALRDEGRIPEQVIRDMHARYIAGKSYPLPVPEKMFEEDLVPYAARTAWPTAILVDVDGTVALRGDRSPYDETRVGEDLPNQPVIAVIRAMHATGCRVIFLSGRSDGCESTTREWLSGHVRIPYELHMRTAGDSRRDSIVKQELFDMHVRDRFNVLLALDDRNQVVALWRALGLTCLQVAEGNF